MWIKNTLSPELSSLLLQERMYSAPDLRGGLATLTKVVDLLPFQNSVSVAEEIWRDASKQFSLVGRCFNDSFQGFKCDQWRRDRVQVSSSAQGLQNTALVKLDIRCEEGELEEKLAESSLFSSQQSSPREVHMQSTPSWLKKFCETRPPPAPYAFDKTWPLVPHNLPPSPSLAWLTAVKRKPKTEAISMADQRSSITRSGVV